MKSKIGGWPKPPRIPSSVKKIIIERKDSNHQIINGRFFVDYANGIMTFTEMNLSKSRIKKLK